MQKQKLPGPGVQLPPNNDLIIPNPFFSLQESTWPYLFGVIVIPALGPAGEPALSAPEPALPAL